MRFPENPARSMIRDCYGHATQVRPMSEMGAPATPGDELARYRAEPSGTRSGVFTQDLIDFVQSGVGIAMAARSVAGRPIPGFAHGVRVTGDTIRLVVDRSIYRDFIEAVEEGSPVAATFTRAIDHRSIQFKGARADILEAEPEDLSRAAAQAAAFRDELITVDYDPAWASLYMAFDRMRCCVVAFHPQAGFVQTPGPGAGAELRK